VQLYPFTPFTDDEMKETLSYNEKLKRRQIPEDILETMTTRSLFFQYVYCDLSKSMYMYNSAQYGFRANVDQLNMLPELLTRPDAGNDLLDILLCMDIETIDDLDCLFMFDCLQRIIAQPEVVKEMSDEIVLEYINTVLKLQESIKILSETNDKWSYPESLSAIMFGLGNIMLKYKYEPFMFLIESEPLVSSFMKGDNLKSEQTVLFINNCISNFINQKSIA